MREFTGAGAVVAILACGGASAQLIELRFTQSPSNVVTLAVDGAASDARDRTIVSLPLVDVETPSAGGAGLTHSYALSGTGFESSVSGSFANGQAPYAAVVAGFTVQFRPLVPVTWTMTGSLSYQGSPGSVNMRATLLNETTDTTVSETRLLSVQATSASFGFGVGGGNTLNTLGPLSGVLFPGNDYTLISGSSALSEMGNPIQGTVVSNFTITFEAIPAPGSAAVFALAGVLAARRRR